MMNYTQEKAVKTAALISGLKAEIASHKVSVVTLGRQMGNETHEPAVEDIKATIAEIQKHLEILDYLTEELERQEGVVADASSL
jgi:hypothetical protein